MDVLQNIVGQKSKPWSGLKALTVGGWGDWELFDLEKAMVAVRTNVVEGSVAAEPRQGALVSFISKLDPRSGVSTGEPGPSLFRKGIRCYSRLPN
jgi:hypothetical protein